MFFLIDAPRVERPCREQIETLFQPSLEAILTAVEDQRSQATNLEDLFDMCGRKFTIKTVCMAAKQMVYLHPERRRFVFKKPANRLHVSKPSMTSL